MFLEICAGIGLLVLFGIIAYKLWENDQPLILDPNGVPANMLIEYQMGGRTHVLEIKSVKQAERNYICVETVDGLIVSINSPEWRVVTKKEGR